MRTLTDAHYLAPRLSPLLRLRSAYHRCWFELSQTIQWSRSPYREQPAGELSPSLTAVQRARIQQLQDEYHVWFEKKWNGLTALDNYVYLDLFSQTAQRFEWRPKRKQELVDIGSLNFYYASALQVFFRPQRLTGIELEGYRVYSDFYSRYDYAQCYIQPFPNVSYTVMDFCEYQGRADGITCFFPFVKPEPLVAWRLPLKVFRPQPLFRRIVRTLNPGGFFLMMNHGEEEADAGFALARAAGLAPHRRPEPLDPLLPRAEAPIASLWTRPH